MGAGVEVHHGAIGGAAVPHIQAVHAIRGRDGAAGSQGKLLRRQGGVAGRNLDIGVGGSAICSAAIPANEGAAARPQRQGRLAGRGYGGQVPSACIDGKGGEAISGGHLQYDSSLGQPCTGKEE